MDAVRVPRLLSATCLVLLLCVAADARAVFRAYLSVNGSDANNCSLATPCRLLPAALAVVDDGGEIWMLDSGNFNASTATVTKSVTILAIPGALGSLVANAGNALVVTGAGIRVVLRNLSFGNLSGAGSGVFFTQGESLLIENCRIFGQGSTGLVAFAASSRLTVRDTVIRNNQGPGVVIDGTVTATLDRVQVIDNAGDGISTSDGASLSVSNSVVSGSGGVGIFARALSGGTTRVTVESSTLSRNFSPGFYNIASGAGSSARSVVARSILTGNNYGAISNASSGGTATLVLDGNTFAQQPNGTAAFDSGVIITRLNNVYTFNTVDSTGASTPLSGQ